MRLYLVTFCLGEHRSHLVPEVGLNFFYISQAKLSTVGKRDGECEVQVGILEAAVGGGRPQAVDPSGGCRRPDVRCGPS